MIMNEFDRSSPLRRRRPASSLLVLFLSRSALLIDLVAVPVSSLSGPKRMPSLADRRATSAATGTSSNGNVAEVSCSTCSDPTHPSYFSLGLDTYRVPMTLHKHNRQRLVRTMMDKMTRTQSSTATSTSTSTNQPHKGLILLEGGKQTTRYDTDHEPVFRQESYFAWTFGVSEADLYGTIALPSGESTLFVPRYDLTYEIFCGASPELDAIKQKYEVDRVLPLEDMASFIKSELGDDESSRLHLLKGLNTDSGNMAIPATYDGIAEHTSKRSFDVLFPSIQQCRVYKTEEEIDLMRYTHWVSSMAHVEVMRSAQPGMMEYQLESLFQHHTYTHGGCRHMSYTCICACGPSASIMHYGHAGRPNDRLLQEGDIALLDMGAEYHCWASDITCSFPVNGIFSDDQLMVYEAVLAAQVAVIQLMRPEVAWTEMHRTAEREILKHLLAAGVLVVGEDGRTDTIDDMIAVDLGAIFMPTGLGHLIGLDTHDVGGYTEGTPPRSDRPGLNKLRTARTLEEGMVLTVEPGCYFIDTLMDMALADPEKAKFINVERLESFRGFGGVRLEDGVLVTSDGCENLTNCPRAVSEVLDVCNGGSWPPEKDVMPEIQRIWVTRDKGRMVKIDVPAV